MFLNYKNLISKLYLNIFNQGGEAVSFLDYLQVIGMTILMMLALVLIIVVAAGIFLLPKKVYVRMLRKDRKAIEEVLKEAREDKNEFMCPTQYAAYTALNRKIRIKIAAFWTILVLFYIPFCIPTILYVANIIVSLF